MTIPAVDETIFPTNLGPEYIGFDHILWYVGNAKQAASYYITRMGFKPIAYRGPETGSPYLASYVIANGGAVFVLTGPVCGPARNNSEGENNALQRATKEDRAVLAAIHEHLTTHGDGVKDVAFRVTGDVGAVWKRAVENGAAAVAEPRKLEGDDEGDGHIMTATVGTYGDTVHSLVNREHYAGTAPFLPGYRVVDGDEDPINQILPPVQFLEIDHCVGNQTWGGVDRIVQLYVAIPLFQTDDKANGL